MNSQVDGLNTFYEGGPRSWNEAFPPVCVKSHWDPTQIAQHVLPAHLIAPQEFDPRQATRVCTMYVTPAIPEQTEPAWKPSAFSAEAQNPLTAGLGTGTYTQQFKIPEVGINLETEGLLGPSYYRRPYDASQMPAIPPGGAPGYGAPNSIYASSVNQESDLFRLDEPLTKCKERRYIPKNGPADATNTLPHVSQAFGLSPYATYVNQTTGCRQADDEAAWNRSGRLFFNCTRLDRVYRREHGPLACGKTA
jgi:hypothetical protein